MTNHALYSLRTDGSSFRITKFVDGEVESSYLSTQYECECPAGHRHSCRHRQMIPDMLAHGIVDTHWFYNFDTRRVVDFNGELKSNLDALNELAITTDITNAPPIQGKDLIDPFYDLGPVGEAPPSEPTVAAGPPLGGKSTPLGNVNHSAPNRTVLGTPKAAWRRM